MAKVKYPIEAFADRFTSPFESNVRPANKKTVKKPAKKKAGKK